MNKSLEFPADHQPAETDPVEVQSAHLESIQLIDMPDAGDEVSGEVSFDDRGDAVWQWHAPAQKTARRDYASRDDSILNHLDIDDLRIVETSELQRVNTVSGRLDIGQRFRERKPEPTGMAGWLKKIGR